MGPGPVTLEGDHVRLEPLADSHMDAVAGAAAGDTELYRSGPVPLARADAINPCGGAAGNQRRHQCCPVRG
jgi:hypothetical protein